MILKIKDISLSFTDSRNETLRLLNSLSLDVPREKITALVGGNGAGKSTLFNIISGFQRADSGTVHFDAKRVDHLPPHYVARLGIGRLFQGRQLSPSLSLLDNFKLASTDTSGEFPFSHILRPSALRQAETAKENRVREILIELFGAGCKYLDMLHTPGGAFSFGEQRLLALARLRMSDTTRLLLLDEPTAGVNPAVCETIALIIQRMVSEYKQTVFLIEHNMPFVRRVADHCTYLAGGSVAATGHPSAVLESPQVKTSYLGLLS